MINKLFTYRPFFVFLICLKIFNSVFSQSLNKSKNNKEFISEYLFNVSKEKLEIKNTVRFTQNYKQIKNTYGNSMYSYFQTKDLKIKKIEFNDLGYFYLDSLYNQIYNQILKNQVQHIEVVEINENCANLPGFICEFKKLQSLELNLFDRDGCEGLDYNNFYSTLFINELFNDISTELKFLKIGNISGNLFIPENSINKFNKLQFLEISTNIYYASVITNFPVSLLLNKKFKIMDIEQNYYSMVGTGTFIDQITTYTQYCNQCFKQNRKKIDVETKIDTIVYRDLSNNIYATGKVNDNNQAEGKWLFYHKNGKLAEERYYQQGIEVGEWMMYDDEGNRVGHYEFKKDTTICTYYKSTGSLGYQYILFNNYTDGIYKRWNDEGVLVTEKKYKSSRYE